MGTIYSFGCESCGYSFNLLDGVGILYHDLDAMIDQLSLPHRSAVEEFRRLTEIKGWTANMQIYECTSCQALSSRLYFSIYSGNGDALVVDYRCSKCFAELKPVCGFNRSRQKCPECGKQTLGDHPLLGDGDWD